MISKFYYQRIYCLFLFFFIASFPVYAGLVIEIESGIDLSGIENIRFEDNVITIKYNKNQQYTIVLPQGALYHIAEWANRDCTGPYIYSIDGALVNPANNYTPPCIPESLHKVFFYFDVFANELCGGATPENSSIHPLVARLGVDALPQNQISNFLSSNSSEGIAYRLLATRYTSYTLGVGQITIKAVPASQGFPINLKADMARAFFPDVWYKHRTAINPENLSVLSLPFAPLRNDIRQNWPEYRKAFAPFNQLSALVEAYALFSGLKLQKPKLWDQIKKEIYKNYLYDKEVDYENGDLENDFGYNEEYEWQNLCIEFIGPKVENRIEADLALSLLYDGSVSDYNEKWLLQIENIAQNVPEIKAKLLLFEIMQNHESNIKSNAISFFKCVENDPELFRLAVFGCLKYKKDEIHSLIDSIEDRLIDIFIQNVHKARNKQMDYREDYSTWQSLSQDVYSTGFFNIAQSKSISKQLKILEDVAYIHYRCGKAYNKSDDFGFIHARFRHLKYISDMVAYLPDGKMVKSRIFQYRKELAQLMGLTGWEDDSDFISLRDELDEERRLNEKASQIDELGFGFYEIEGKIRASSYLFKKEFTANQNLKDLKTGVPAGITTSENQFILLLVDSRIFYRMYQESKQGLNLKVQVLGILHDEGRSMTPYCLKYELKKGQWVSFDMPVSGIDGPAALSGEKN